MARKYWPRRSRIRRESYLVTSGGMGSAEAMKNAVVLRCTRVWRSLEVRPAGGVEPVEHDPLLLGRGEEADLDRLGRDILGLLERVGQLVGRHLADVVDVLVLLLFVVLVVLVLDSGGGGGRRGQRRGGGSGLRLVLVVLIKEENILVVTTL
jgi:hypothetical protein